MKLGLITKLDKKTKHCQNNLMVTSFHKIVIDIFSICDQSGSAILDALSVKFIFSLIVTFYLTKTKNRTNSALTLLL